MTINVGQWICAANCFSSEKLVFFGKVSPASLYMSTQSLSKLLLICFLDTSEQQIPLSKVYREDYTWSTGTTIKMTAKKYNKAGTWSNSNLNTNGGRKALQCRLLEYEGMTKVSSQNFLIFECLSSKPWLLFEAVVHNFWIYCLIQPKIEFYIAALY